MSTRNSNNETGFQTEKTIERSSLTHHDLVAEEGSREGLLSVLCQLAWIIGLASVVVVALTGEFPWFLVSLSVILFFSACMPLRQIRQKAR